MSDFVVDIGRGKTVRLPTSGKYCPEDILIVGDPYGKREIAEGVLTDAEKNVFATIVPGSYFTVSLFVETMYALAGIDIEPIFGKLGFFDILKKMFNVDTGHLLPEEERDETFNKMLQTKTHSTSYQMLFGGKRYTSQYGKWSNSVLSTDNLKVGDIFMAAQEAPCEVNNVRWVYFCGIYQGGGKFLMAENHSNAACIDWNKIYIDECDVTENTAVWGTADEMNRHRYYFVLRPENLATE